MMDDDTSRRGALRTLAGTVTLAGAAGTSTAQQAPEFGDYLDDATGYDGTVEDMRGQDSVTIEVGAGDGFAFDPAVIWIDPGTTVTWEWTGQGGGHNVVVNEGPADFGHDDIVSEPGYTYEYEFTDEDAGITTYRCTPHEAMGMKGGIAVGGDTGGATGPDLTDSLAIGTALAIGATLALTYAHLRFGGREPTPASGSAEEPTPDTAAVSEPTGATEAESAVEATAGESAAGQAATGEPESAIVKAPSDLTATTMEERLVVLAGLIGLATFPIFAYVVLGPPIAGLVLLIFATVYVLQRSVV